MRTTRQLAALEPMVLGRLRGISGQRPSRQFDTILQKFLRDVKSDASSGTGYYCNLIL